MTERNDQDDVGAFKRALLRSAALDARPMPSAVRKRLLTGASSAAGLVAASGALASGKAAATAGISVFAMTAKWIGVGAIAATAGIGVLQATRGVAPFHFAQTPIGPPASSPGRMANQSRETPSLSTIGDLRSKDVWVTSGPSHAPAGAAAPSSTQSARDRAFAPPRSPIQKRKKQGRGRPRNRGFRPGSAFTPQPNFRPGSAFTPQPTPRRTVQCQLPNSPTRLLLSFPCLTKLAWHSRREIRPVRCPLWIRTPSDFHTAASSQRRPRCAFRLCFARDTVARRASWLVSFWPGPREVLMPRKFVRSCALRNATANGDGKRHPAMGHHQVRARSAWSSTRAGGLARESVHDNPLGP